MTKPESFWEPPPAALSLSGDEVHVWGARLQLPAERIEELSFLLSADERARAARFRFPEYGERFTATRGVLRLLLGGYLDAAPESLCFAYGDHGKPFLSGPHSHSGLRFNLSHSHLIALYALTKYREVGIDVEYPRPKTNWAKIAARFFAKGEVEALQNLPAALQREGFFNCWTRKEAYLKARGEGITIALDSFTVSLKPGEPAALLSSDKDPEEVGRWRLQGLIPEPGYVAAVCAEDGDWKLRCWQWLD